MIGPFLKYNFKYLFFAKTRQRLLFMAIVGLFLSSFSLIILQSIMGGLQSNLIGRSKNFHGQGTIHLKQLDPVTTKKLEEYLQSKNASFVKEYQIEMLMRYENFLSPVIVHGVSSMFDVPFLKEKDLSGIVVGGDLSYHLKVAINDKVQIISPAHTDPLLGDVPMQVTTSISDTVYSQVADIDQMHAWVRASKIHQVIKSYSFNTFRVFSSFEDIFDDLPEGLSSKVILRSWQDKNVNLMQALNLETTVMLVMFIAMTLLVAISITSGFFIFYEKIQKDLMSFWILGSSKKQLLRNSKKFIYLLNAIVCLLSLISGLCFLYYLDNYAGQILPDMFVDQKLPVNVTLKGIAIAFLVPFAISVIFSKSALGQIFSDRESYLSKLRSIG